MDRSLLYLRVIVVTFATFAFLLFGVGAMPYDVDAQAQTVAQRVAGRIVLQVERNGEAWYVSPQGVRYYMGRPADAFALMRSLGVGIADNDVKKILVADHANLSRGVDTDGDGLSDNVERAFGTSSVLRDTDSDGYDDRTEVVSGYDPLNTVGKLPINTVFSRAQVGKIFLQVERNGEAWYVYPPDLKRYYMGRPDDAFALMRSLGLGISNADLAQIPVAATSAIPPMDGQQVAQTPSGQGAGSGESAASEGSSPTTPTGGTTQGGTSSGSGSGAAQVVEIWPPVQHPAWRWDRVKVDYDNYVDGVSGSSADLVLIVPDTRIGFVSHERVFAKAVNVTDILDLQYADGFIWGLTPSGVVRISEDGIHIYTAFSGPPCTVNRSFLFEVSHRGDVMAVACTDDESVASLHFYRTNGVFLGEVAGGGLLDISFTDDAMWGRHGGLDEVVRIALPTLQETRYHMSDAPWGSMMATSLYLNPLRGLMVYHVWDGYGGEGVEGIYLYDFLHNKITAIDEGVIEDMEAVVLYGWEDEDTLVYQDREGNIVKQSI